MTVYLSANKIVIGEIQELSFQFIEQLTLVKQHSFLDERFGKVA